MSETSEATFASDADLFGSTEFSVTTDKADYAPGETAIITASGVDVGGSLTFEVDHISDPGPDGIYGTSDDITTDLGGSGHESWTIVDGGEGDLDGIANGVIVTEWYVDPDDSLNETFLLTASDGAATAYASFTDGASYNLDQWRNGPDTAHVPDDGDEWVNGNLNENQAHYYQGDFVAYRATLSDLTQGSYFITMEYDVTQGGEYSIDYLGSYDASFGPGETHDGDLIPDPVDGTGLDGTVDSLLEVALSPLIDAGPDGIQGTADDISPEVGSIAMFDGQLTGFAFAGADGTVGTADDVYYLSGNGIWGDGDEAMVTGISDYLSGSYTLTDTITSEEVGDAVYTLSGDVTGNAQQSVTLIFDYTGTNGGDAVLAWGGHIATNEDWDDMANPSGSPYHMRLLDMKAFEDDGSTIQVTGAGNQDRSLSRSAIVLDNPDFEVTKTADVASVDAAGDVITYTIAITNTGDVALTGVSVSDPLLGALSGPSGDTNLDGALDVDEVWTYSGSYSVLQADLDSNGTAEPDDNDDNDGDPLTVEDPDGDIDNLVTVSVAEIEEAKTARADVDIVQDPSIDVVKTNAGVDDLDGNGDDAGDEIVYSYAVTNDGNVTLFDVSAVDDKLGNILLISGLTDEDGDGFADDLAVGATANGTALQVLTQDIVDAGTLTNIVLANGTDPMGGPVGDDDTNTVSIDRSPAIQVVKSNGGVVDLDANGDDAGDKVDYSYVVSNIGNVTLFDVTADDDLLGAILLTTGLTDEDGDGVADDLAVGASAEGTATEILDQAQVDNGIVVNVVTADGTGANGQDVSDQDSNEVPVIRDPSISISKVTTHEGTEGDDLSGVVAGDFVGWKYYVSNTGNVTLTDPSIVDDHGPLDPDFGTGDGGIVEVMSGGWNVGDSDMNGVFDVGEQWVYVSSFELEVPDNLISYTNEATATAETTVDPQQVSDSDTSGFALLPPGMVTNSALCDFGEVFQVNFSPDKDGTFTQNSTNPGQYFYNTIFDYDQEFTNGDGTDNVLTMKIPDGFVLQSGDPNFENAVHVYDSVSVEFDAEGNICLIPGAEISRDLYTVSFQYNPDGTMEAIVNFGDSDLTGLTYVNIHLDYETKGSDGWEPKDGVDAVNGNPPDGYELDGIQDGWSYDFDAMLTDGADTSDTDFGDSVMNDNVFKPFKQSGFGGYVWSDDTGTEDAIYETGEGIEGALVMIFDSDGNEIDSATTDEDGWWYSGFTHKGKQASYTVELHADGTDDGAGTEDATAIATLGKGDKFDAVHFYEDDLDQFQSLEVA